MLVRLYTLYRAISSYAGRQERNKKKMDSTWVRDPAHLTSFNLRVGESADFLNRFSCISSKNLWRNMHHWNFDEFLRNSPSKSVNFEESLYFYCFLKVWELKELLIWPSWMKFYEKFWHVTCFVGVTEQIVGKI